MRPWFFFVSPAYAGKSKSAVHASCCGQDHPRVCGEKAYKRVISGSLWGSPPRMRGKASGPSERRACVRITPAYAGKRLLGRLPGMGGPDHPRACGEKDLSEAGADELGGSPPRMRGKVNFPAQVRPFHGITPAHAEKRRSKPTSWTCPGDHPRVCGEKYFRPRWLPCTVGSPPRMRGKVIAAAEGARTRRITPVYAGKRGRCPRPVGRRWDHPRVCGEKTVL